MIRTIVVLVCFSLQLVAAAQCPTCVADPQCVSADGFPTICPLDAPTATVGAYYEEGLTFFLPSTIVDPGSGVNATLISVTITSVTGLPYGLVFTLNDADNTYYPSAGENLGCATICGTPLLPGVYGANIVVSAVVSALGFQFTQVETFVYTIEVLPGSGSTSTFTYDTPAACDNLQVNFAATIELPAPTITNYAWDFGNGQVSNNQSVGPIMYSTPGTYVVSLTTTAFDYQLQSVSIANVAGGWGADIDDFFNNPDIYFVLTDGGGNTTYTSTTIDNSTSGTWSNLNLILTAPPYSLSFYDEDDFTQDDFLGTSSLPLVSGTAIINSGTGTAGTAQVGLIQTSSITESTEVVVFPGPDTQIIANENSVSVVNTNQTSYLWTVNGAFVSGGTGPSVALTQGGVYQCQITNEFGCEALSDTHLHCPPVAVQYDALAQELSVPQGFVSYQWYLNGLLVPGATQFYLLVEQSGNYAVQVTTNYGCSGLSQVYILNLGADEQETHFYQAPDIYPNPTEQGWNIVWNSDFKQETCYSLYDFSGKRVYFNCAAYAVKEEIPAANLAQGMYVLKIRQGEVEFKKILLKK